MGERVGRVSSDAVSRWSRSPGCCGFRGVFWVGWIFSCYFFFVFFFEHTRPAASVKPLCLIDFSTSNEAIFAIKAKKLFILGCIQGAII